MTFKTNARVPSNSTAKPTTAEETADKKPFQVKTSVRAGQNGYDMIRSGEYILH